MPRVISLIAPLALLVLAAACVNSDTPTPTASDPSRQNATASPTPFREAITPAGLGLAISRVPMGYVDEPLLFANFGIPRSMIGAMPREYVSIDQIEELVVREGGWLRYLDVFAIGIPNLGLLTAWNFYKSMV